MLANSRSSASGIWISDALYILLVWKGITESPIQGTDGNREFLAWFAVAS